MERHPGSLRSRPGRGNDLPYAGDCRQPAAGFTCSMPVSELFLKLLDLVRDDHDLPGVGLDDGSNKRRDSKLVSFVSEDTVDQLADPLNPHRGDHAKFGQMAAQGIYQHGPLTDQQGPGPVDHQH